MRDYYEDLWARLPDHLEPPDRELRLRFLLANLGAGDQVLDLGCGDGWMTAELAARGVEAIGVELAQAAIDRARDRHPQLDLRRLTAEGGLPVADNAVDVVWASEVIEHVADTGRWLSEVRRVLRPGGRLLITTPDHSRLRLALGGIGRYSMPLGDHLHLYDARSLRGVLDDFDFVDAVIRRAGGPPLARRLLLARATR